MPLYDHVKEMQHPYWTTISDTPQVVPLGDERVAFIPRNIQFHSKGSKKRIDVLGKVVGEFTQDAFTYTPLLPSEYKEAFETIRRLAPEEELFFH